MYKRVLVAYDGSREGRTALREGACTGAVGDGKIFVVGLEQVVRIRSGETDAAAVPPVEP